MLQSLQQALKMAQTAALDPDPSCSEQPCIVPWQVCSAVKSHSQLVLDQGQMNGHYYVALLVFFFFLTLLILTLGLVQC